MKISKKIIVLSLATALTISPIMVNANSHKEVINVNDIEEEVLVEKQEVEYIKYTGKIVEINKEGSNSILVKDNEEDDMNGEVYHINEKVIILDTKTNNIVAKEELKVGMTVTTYTHKNTPVALSSPAQRTPNVIVINEEIGEEVEVEETQEILVIDKILINEKEINLEKELYNNEDGMAMIPLRQIVEELGYEVKWNNESRSIELTKGVQWTSLTIGEDNYNFAKMIVKLGAAPELKEGTTFIPLTFVEEVLKVEINITDTGKIKIIK